ncbi:SDR family NAD(P)-dependent oxidoreductase [Aminobacter sp. Piv2-1]|uniref:SDR family NAD(P)-dependent oxidoreductase n=1 Tax=Aminobacter sp. Piv2-1 TaxID=3031122 RepID=UPI00309FBC86
MGSDFDLSMRVPSKGRLSGKVAMVVGSGSSGSGWGNGKASAVLYAREGAKVFLVDIDESAVKETAKTIHDEGNSCSVGVGNACDPIAAERFVNACLDAFGRIDILHNNIGVPKFGNPVELSLADWDASWTINVTSAFLMCKYVLPQMEGCSRGSVINVSSIAAHRYLGAPYTAYYTTKAAVVQFTRAIAAQYACKGIRANTILPGFIDTPAFRASVGPNLEGYSANSAANLRAKQTPLGRMGSAWDVAYAALYLASDESSYVTGSELIVDGGVSACSGVT